MNILKEIIENKKRELAETIRLTPVSRLEKSPMFRRPVVPLAEYLMDPARTGIIAEFKRKSPSKGIINDTADPEKIISGYSRYGASGVSVLTEQRYFGGVNSDLSVSREVCSVPMLRKDFIIDEYQIIEARAIGADAILLIAAVLSEKQVFRLARFAHSLGLQVLLEIHNRSEAGIINEYVNVAGVNNRDLQTFAANTDTSVELADALPANLVRISESGISTPEIIKKLRDAGYHGFLIGEKFMCTPDPVKAFSEFIKLIK